MKNDSDSEHHTALSPDDEAEMRQIILEVLHEAEGDLDADEVCERALYRKTQRDVDWLVRHGLLVRCGCGSHIHPKYASQHTCGIEPGSCKNLNN